MEGRERNLLATPPRLFAESTMLTGRQVEVQVIAKAGTEITVASVQRKELPRKISRVEVDATRQRVIAYDKSDGAVAVYPATVGSGERPSPSGAVKGA